MLNKDLRDAAINAIANYMHYELYEKGVPENMLPFMKIQAELLMTGCDNAIEKTIARGKEIGLIEKVH